MASSVFIFSTILICYNCRRQAVVFIRPLDNKNRQALSLRFVACGVCLRFPHVFNPRSSLRRGYTDLQRYSDMIATLEDRFRRSVTILQKRRFFCLTRLSAKAVGRIENCDSLRIEDGLFVTLHHEEAGKFFSGESASLASGAALTIQPEGGFAQPRQLPIPDLEEPAPPYTT